MVAFSFIVVPSHSFSNCNSFISLDVDTRIDCYLPLRFELIELIKLMPLSLTGMRVSLNRFPAFPSPALEQLKHSIEQQQRNKTFLHGATGANGVVSHHQNYGSHQPPPPPPPPPPSASALANPTPFATGFAAAAAAAAAVEASSSSGGGSKHVVSTSTHAAVVATVDKRHSGTTHYN